VQALRDDEFEPVPPVTQHRAQPSADRQSLRAILTMCAGAVLLTGSDAASKYLTQSYPVGQVICLRQAATLLAIVPYIMFVTGWAAARPVNIRGQLGRGLLFVAGSGFMVLALSLLPLTTVIAIVFTSPIFVALLSVPMLGERVGRRRWVTVVVGFVGVLLIVRPGAAGFEWVLLLPVLTALANGTRDIVTRKLSRTDTSISILLWSTLIVMIAGLATAPFGWNAVDANGALWFLLAGLCNAGAHFLVIEALRLGEASLVAPFRYTAFLWAILFGFVMWGEIPGLWVALGVVLIVGGGVYGMRGETQRKA
jgi:drug/metabolite transporter (DMT)-like permease